MSDKENSALIEIELFIERMEKETGVSKRFLNVVRSSIDRAFGEVSIARRYEYLTAIEASCRTQAEIEKSIEQSIKNTKKLASVEQKIVKSLTDLKTETKQSRDRMMATDFNWGLKQDDRYSIN